MSERRSTRWFAEFVIIVLGVLVALAVDDWRQYRLDRELEEHLLGRLADDLASDAADLGVAQVMVARRLWVLEALGAAAGEDTPTRQTPRSDLFDPIRADSLMGAGGRSLGPWDSIQAPLRAFVTLPEFDLSDDSYQEMLATGGLGTIGDLPLRAQILAYYRTAEDMGDNVRRAAEYEDRFEEALSRIDAAIGDPLALSDLASRVEAEPPVRVETRHARARILLQFNFFRQIDSARTALERVLSEAVRAAG